jgi:hypothetical protein
MLHWALIALIIGGALSVLGVAFLLGRKWRKGLTDAKAHRQSLEADVAAKSEALSDLRAQLTNSAQATGNTVHVEVGSGVQSELHKSGYGETSSPLGALPCAVCGGPHRGFDCRERSIDVGGHRFSVGELLSGLDHGGVALVGRGVSAAVRHDVGYRALGSAGEVFSSEVGMSEDGT